MVGRRLLIFSIVALLVAACGAEGPTSAAVPATTADDAIGTTASPPTTSTSTPAPTATSAPAPVDPAGDALPDGTNFGFITELTVIGDRAAGQFDLAQLFTGAEAEAAAAEDGGEVTNDVWIRNVNPRLRPIELGAEVDFNVVLDGDGCCDPVGATLDDFAANVGPETPVMLTVAGGVITRADELFFP